MVELFTNLWNSEDTRLGVHPSSKVASSASKGQVFLASNIVILMLRLITSSTHKDRITSVR